MFAAAAAVAAATEVSGDALSLLSAQAALLFSSQRTHRWTRVTPPTTHSLSLQNTPERAPVMVVCSSATLHASIRPPLRPSALLSDRLREVSLKHYWRRSEWEAAAAPSRKESEAGERAPRLQRERGARKGRKRPLSFSLSQSHSYIYPALSLPETQKKRLSLCSQSLSVSLSQCSRRVSGPPAPARHCP